MNIKQLVKQYQKTGIFTKEMNDIELKYIKKNIFKWYCEYNNLSKKQFEYNFDIFLSLQIGIWEAKLGFALDSNHKQIKKLLGKE